MQALIALERFVIRTPEMIASVDACVARVLAHCAGTMRMAAPLGLGKPNVLLNAIYRHVCSDSASSLTLYTALSLARPHPKNDLERRFLDPFLKRHFGADYPDLAYVAAQHAGALPANVRIHEFYLQSGAMLGVAQAQRDYASQNYTHVARDLVDADINVVVQLIAVREENGVVRYSLASNPDVSADLLDRIAGAGKPRPLVVGVVHEDLPFVGNDAEVGVNFFDVLLRDPVCRHTLFALPREPVELAEFAIGLHASALVRDGGTLQIGIGALSDAVVYALRMRHAANADWLAALDALRAGKSAADGLQSRIGGIDIFTRGLYGASEMVMDGFMHLVRAGILSRRVYDDLAIEKALADGRIGELMDEGAAENLYATGIVPAHIDARELARLVRFGILPVDTKLLDDELHLADGLRLPADLRDAAARASWNKVLAGRRLCDGRYLRGAFYLGSVEFYSWLRTLQGDAFAGLSMTRVSDINQLYGGRESLDALQRRDARFFNTCMMATALGAAVSDALENGQVVSGVGGQYNFVAMAHALDDGRSVLLLRSTRSSHGVTHSNILWNYGHTTIPRHLRDVFVTEYGVADLRGRSDEECVMRMLAITDARFMDDLADRARRDGKLRAGFVIPDAWRRNTPERLNADLAALRARGLFPAFPFGTDFTSVELELLPALQLLQRVSSRKITLAGFLLKSLLPMEASDRALACLDRLGLSHPDSMKARVLRRLLLLALKTGARNPHAQA